MSRTQRTHSLIVRWVLLYRGDRAGAITTFHKTRALDPGALNESALAYAYAIAGDRDRAEQVVLALERKVNQRYVSPSLRMMLHLGLGEKETALEWLEKCYEDQDVLCVGLKVYPIYDPLRNEPRFQALLKKVFPNP